MKRFYSILLGAILLASFIGVPVLAEDGTTDGTTETQTEMTQAEKDALALKEAEAQKKKEQLKAEALKNKATEAAKTRLKQRCKGAQANLGTLGDKVNSNLPNRNKAYENLISRLDKLIPKLQTKNIDTAALEEKLATLKTMVEDYKIAITDYQDSLKELKEMGCQENPDAFKAALEVARTERTALGTQLEAIKTFVKQDVKTALADVRTKLAADEETE